MSEDIFTPRLRLRPLTDADAEAAEAIVGVSWDLLGLESVQAWTQPENAASIAILKRLGMSFLREGPVFAAARQREETCLYFEIRRPPAGP